MKASTSFISPLECKKIVPFPERHKENYLSTLSSCIDLLNKKESRIALFLGPCSVHDEKEVLEYAYFLKEIQKELKEHFLILMRVFVEKSRTKDGWKGFFYDPNLDFSYEIEKGVLQTRKLFSELIQMAIPIACELLDPFVVPYYRDFISWGFIGARTSSSQPHRQMVSGLRFPVGFKNGIDGDLLQAIYGTFAAQKRQGHLSLSEEGKICKELTSGNPYTHLVLRGSTNASNYDQESIAKALSILERENLPQVLLVDCSHGNAKKTASLQKEAFTSIIHQIAAGNRSIRGVMLESFFQTGSQSLSVGGNLRKGLSVTDPCLGWEDTKELLYWALEKLNF